MTDSRAADLCRTRFSARDRPHIERENDRVWNVIDSCGWLGYFANGWNAEFLASRIGATDPSSFAAAQPR